MSIELDRPLPNSIHAERAILGSLILQPAAQLAAFSHLAAEDFSLEKHRRIFRCLFDIDAGGGKIDRLTLAQSLRDRGWLESVDGLTYLSELDVGLPEFPSIESYIETVREKAALRRVIFASQALVNRCMEADEAAVDIIASAERALLTISESGVKRTAEMMNPGEVVEAAGGIQQFLAPRRGSGIITPWVRLTDLTGGYRAGELIVLAGNPGMGKSAAALQIAGATAQQGRGVLFFSMEMSRTSLVERIACSRARVDSSKVRAGYTNSEERERLRRAITAVWDWPLWIAEDGLSTVLAMRAAIRRHRAKHEVFMIVIDYLQLMKSIGRWQNCNAEISDITRALKLLAVDEQVNIHLLSQLSRANMTEKRAPALHDLRESGSIEQDADAAMFVWRPEVLSRDREDLKGVAELLLLKQRNGPIGKIDLVWLAHLTKFENQAGDLDGEDPAQERLIL